MGRDRAAAKDVIGHQERLWDSIAEQSPDSWSQSMKVAARAWNTHRQSQD
ncbi:hypothetical protein [Streptomyces aureus]